MKAEEIIKQLDTQNIFSKTYLEIAIASMEKYTQQKQSEIDELVDFINRILSENNLINEDDKLEAIDLINK